MQRVWWRRRKVEYPKGCRSSASLGEWQLAGKYDRNHDPEFDVIPQVPMVERLYVQYLTTSLTEYLLLIVTVMIWQRLYVALDFKKAGDC
jgi:hypothetical protein